MSSKFKVFHSWFPFCYSGFKKWKRNPYQAYNQLFLHSFTIFCSSVKWFLNLSIYRERTLLKTRCKSPWSWWVGWKLLINEATVQRSNNYRNPSSKIYPNRTTGVDRKEEKKTTQRSAKIIFKPLMYTLPHPESLAWNIRRASWKIFYLFLCCCCVCV